MAGFQDWNIKIKTKIIVKKIKNMKTIQEAKIMKMKIKMNI